ncbi:splicing factor [Anaeramoeba flamelloides]|uniref:Splicing factor n=1 Tax=Anaeramoeba flamelloides TaxID=1746091 RepID=A0AAV7ZHF6_9EUKA|nr:splicing factor [Anaeramoeba flamelloides]
MQTSGWKARKKLVQVPIFLPNNLEDSNLEAILLRIRLEEICSLLDEKNFPSSDILYPDLKGETGIKDGLLVSTKRERAIQKLREEKRRLKKRCSQLSTLFKLPEEEIPEPQFIQKRVLISSMNLVGVLLGPKGSTIEKIKRETNTKIIIQGKGMVAKSKNPNKATTSTNNNSESDEIRQEPLHALIVGTEQEQVDQAEKIVRKITTAIPDEFNELKRNQLRELAMIKGGATVTGNSSYDVISLAGKRSETAKPITSSYDSRNQAQQELQNQKIELEKRKLQLQQQMKFGNKKMESDYIHLMKQINQGIVQNNLDLPESSSIDDNQNQSQNQNVNQSQNQNQNQSEIHNQIQKQIQQQIQKNQLQKNITMNQNNQNLQNNSNSISQNQSSTSNSSSFLNNNLNDLMMKRRRFFDSKNNQTSNNNSQISGNETSNINSTSSSSSNETMIQNNSFNNRQYIANNQNIWNRQQQQQNTHRHHHQQPYHHNNRNRFQTQQQMNLQKQQQFYHQKSNQNQSNLQQQQIRKKIQQQLFQQQQQKQQQQQQQSLYYQKPIQTNKQSESHFQQQQNQLYLHQQNNRQTMLQQQQQQQQQQKQLQPSFNNLKPNLSNQFPNQNLIQNQNIDRNTIGRIGDNNKPNNQNLGIYGRIRSTLYLPEKPPGTDGALI